MTIGLEKAILYFGSQAALGRELGLKRTTVNSWVKKRSRMPAEVAVTIEKLTRSTVLREDLRPDLFSR